MLVGGHTPAHHEAVEVGDAVVGAAQLDCTIHPVFKVPNGHVLMIHPHTLVKIC